MKKPTFVDKEALQCALIDLGTVIYNFDSAAVAAYFVNRFPAVDPIRALASKQESPRA